jgi:hypothetical protein
VPSIEKRRDDTRDATQDEMRQKDKTRYKPQTDSDKVVVDVTAASDIKSAPKWDKFENNHFAMRRRLVSIFLRVANTVITRIRASKRLEKIRIFVESNEIRSRQEMKAKV